MADHGPPASVAHDQAPGAQPNARDPGVASYLIGLGLAIILTGASFWAAGTNLIWSQAVPIALAVLAIAQMGVHLVFFLHLSSSPDNTNNILALAFGILIVFLVVAGSLWIMANLDYNMLPMSELMRMQR